MPDATTTLRINMLALTEVSSHWKAALKQIVAECGGDPNGQRAVQIAEKALAAKATQAARVLREVRKET